jgi:2'-5' RNA ligase
METIRAFVAIDSGDGMRRAIIAAADRLRRAKADVKWAAPETIHLTLAFMGHLPTEQIEPLSSALDHTLVDVPRFNLHLAGIGTFGAPRRPKVVWAGVADNPALMDLQRRIAGALRAEKIEVDDRPFSPHVTLGRVKSVRRIGRLLDAIVAERERDFGVSAVTEVLLMRSVTDPAGAQHSLLHRTALGYSSAAGTVK